MIFTVLAAALTLASTPALDCGDKGCVVTSDSGHVAVAKTGNDAWIDESPGSALRFISSVAFNADLKPLPGVYWRHPKAFCRTAEFIAAASWPGAGGRVEIVTSDGRLTCDPGHAPHLAR